MGSYGDWTKENHPVGNFVQKFNERHNIACEKRARDAPLRMKFLALLGFRRPFDRWCADTPLHIYLDKLPKFWEEDENSSERG